MTVSTRSDPVRAHRAMTKKLAKGLKWTHVYHWLVEHGYFPESYVLPPCFRVKERPKRPKLFFKVKYTKKGTQLRPTPRELCAIDFPKTELVDTRFALIHPELHNDICYHIARNWTTVVKRLIPDDSDVVSYSFPVPLNTATPGELGDVRTGRLIYEYIAMTEDDLAELAFRYTHLVKADVKSFYPSIYTHSIAWAMHGKRHIRKPGNRRDYRYVGNRLDRLFQHANDQRTNGLPIGPVVADIAAELIAAAVDRKLTKAVKGKSLDCVMVRFKDDYRILTRSDSEARQIIKMLQAALKEYDLELNGEKTAICSLPEGLFRHWVSLYHAAYPSQRKRLAWREFRELYLAVLRIDNECPGSGVVDRFLADIVSREGDIKIRVAKRNLRRVMSMLLMLGNRRTKAFPKVIAIIEAILRSPEGARHIGAITEFLRGYLETLMEDEARNGYLISWITYFFVSNGLRGNIPSRPARRDPLVRSVFNNRGAVFKDAKEFKLFEGAISLGRRISMLEHLDVFSPPASI